MFSRSIYQAPKRATLLLLCVISRSERVATSFTDTGAIDLCVLCVFVVRYPRESRWYFVPVFVS